MAGLVRQEGRVVSRERALRGAGIDLVAAAGREQVYAAAISGVDRLIDGESCVRLALANSDGASVVASSDGASWNLVPATAEWLGRIKSGVLRIAHAEMPTLVGTDLRLTHGEAVAVLPLSVRSDVRGLLIVSTTARISPEVADSLDALGTQVSLALEGASLAEDLHRRQSEARFRSLVAHSSDLITVLNADGVVTYQSPPIDRLLAFSADEAEGTRFDRPLSEADGRRLPQRIAAAGPGRGAG